jgi:transcriptional regulator with XRE-family HTH domain
MIAGTLSFQRFGTGGGPKVTSHTRRALGDPFAVALYRLRDARGWSQQDIARRLGVAVNTVSRWERGEIVRPDPVHRRRLAALFDVTVEQLALTRPQLLLEGDPPSDSSASQEAMGLPPLAASPSAPDTLAEAKRTWQGTRRALNVHRHQLSGVAFRLYHSLEVGTSLLTLAGWLPRSPIPLDQVTLDWVKQPPTAQVIGTESVASRVLPYYMPGRRYGRYTQALRDLAPPRLLENRLSYRLLDINFQSTRATLTFGLTTYFELVDLSEALAHELAATHLVREPTGEGLFRPPSWRRLPLRRLVADPFNLTQRSVPCSINTLTIRRDPHGEASIILHYRDPDRVAVCGSMYHVMPAGVFQPASMVPNACKQDFDLWRNILREYAEEYLGDLDCDGNAAAMLDCESRQPFKALQEARRSGKLQIWVLGVGLDPLTLWGELLIAVVVDAETFDNAFEGLVSVNQEGTVIKATGRNTHGVPFSNERVEQLLNMRVAPAAAACLKLAWRRRDILLGGR